MTQPANNPPQEPIVELTAPRLVGDAAGIATAKKLFTHATKAENTRNYDYAIELYTQGLAHWPDALEDGLNPLWRVAHNRMAAGGKPAGFRERRKHPTNTKDEPVNLNNALFLFGHNPNDLATQETVLTHAVKSNCDAAARFIARIIAGTLALAKKQSSSHYQKICDELTRIGRVARDANQDAASLEIFQAQLNVARVWRKHYPDSSEAHRAESAASGDLAIVTGRFNKDESFTGSLENAEAQHELQEKERPATTDDRRQRAIDAARRDWEANPTIANKLLNLADLIAKTETDADELAAIKLLDEEYEKSNNFQYRKKSDELRMRRLDRERRALLKALKADPNDDEVREEIKRFNAKKLETETRIFTIWLKHYPTDLGLKFQLGRRMFDAGKYDEAIPLFQQARSDGRVRNHARLYLGRCFFEKRFYDQAVDVLRQGKDEITTRSDEIYLNLTYWLARALEENGAAEEAKKAYGEIIQTDYNFKDGDARKRLEALVAGD